MTIRAKSCVINNGWEVELPHHPPFARFWAGGGTFEGEYIPNRQNALERGVRYTNMLNRPEFVGKYP